MLIIRHVSTYVGSSPSFVTNVSDLQTMQLSTGTYLYSSSQLGGGLAAYRLTDPGEVIRTSSTQAYPGSAAHVDAPQVSLLDLGSETSAFVTGIGGGWVNGFSMTRAGELVSSVSLGGMGLPSDVTHLGSFEAGGGRFLYSTRNGNTAIDIWRVRSDGGGEHSSTSRPSAIATPVQGTEIDDVEVVTIADRSFVISTSALGNFVAAQMITASGGLGPAAVIGALHGLGLNGPRHVESVTVNGVTYLVVASSQSSSLTTLRLDYGGGLTPADHVIDELGTRFNRVTALETVEVDGRSYILVGGADDGISVFTIQPNGDLLLLATLADTNDRAMQDVSAIAAIAMSGRIAVFVSSRTERGITQFQFDPGAIGLTATAAAGQASGTARDDLIQASAGTTSIHGGAGDDILISASAPISLAGGDGADLFVGAAVDGRIRILDYEPGVDRLDLSNLGMLRSTAQLTFKTQSYGILITFGTTQIEIRTRDGGSLSAGAFNNSMFPVAHYVVSGMRTYVTGTSGADTLGAGTHGSNISGQAGRDVLIGGLGNDLLLGGSDNDTIQGGAGNDSLQGNDGNDLLRGGSGNDLLLGGGHDDQIFGETGNDSLYGEAGNDLLYGEDGNDILSDTLGHNTLMGGNGNDSLSAGGGADRIDGGAGDDTLIGGSGNDVMTGGDEDDRIRGESGNDRLRGGSGNDRMGGGSGDDRLYGDAGNDLGWGGPGNDWMSGGLGNDRLAGETGNDTLTGDQGHDWLSGLDGFDFVVGGDGNDTLHGGTGNDRLRGDAGNDWLSGDVGNDTLIGGDGDDTLRSGSGVNLVHGQGGNDLMQGGIGNDRIYGGTGSDQIVGNGGSDLLVGSSGNDTIRSGASTATGGRNQIIAGTGHDLILGGRDVDLVRGGTGRDRMTGGGGADLFIFRTGDFDRSVDVITDFTRGADRIDMRWLDLDFVGERAFSGTGQIRMWHSASEGLVLDINLSGNRDPELRILLGHIGDLTQSDFLL